MCNGNASVKLIHLKTEYLNFIIIERGIQYLNPIFLCRFYSYPISAAGIDGAA